MKRILKGRKEGFTLAEILLSLTVIGIVAAIALPSLLGNANERAWETQKKALHTRMAQAIPLLPSMNGYGQLSSTTSGNTTTITDTAAETFVRDGLSKVMKITNICGVPQGTTGTDAATKLKDCGLPDKIIPLDGSMPINLSSITTFGDLNQYFTSGVYAGSVPLGYQQQDSNAAAFETTNGESILAYYNPHCTTNLYENSENGYVTQPKVCANFIYDLNGIKGPNTVGKDIGFMTVLYATDSDVVAPIPYPNVTSSIKQTEAAAKCKELYTDGRMPNIQEAISMFTNAKLMNNYEEIWTSTSFNSTQGYAINMGSGGTYPVASSTAKKIMCLKH